MARILYLSFPDGRLTGGQKMILRHVQTLRELGFDARLWLGPSGRLPEGATATVPVEPATPFQADDVLVIPEDAKNALAAAAGFPQRTVVFCQGHIKFAYNALDALNGFPAERFPPLIAVGPTVAEAVGRLFPDASVEVVRGFVDDQLFAPRGAAALRVALTPSKRPFEADLIQKLLPQMHPRHADLQWTVLEGLPEAQVAEAFAGSALFLSLARMEGLGLTALEAMASGAICCGFLGLGGRDFGADENGFWAPEDDCFAAADALAQAADLVKAGGPALERMRKAGLDTARRWSPAVFRRELEAVWMRLAPQARRREGPLG
ncbi:glycosyltransferase [Phenylobacterium deserti]|uniref:Glycosyl transferase family 1 domain-containing protein n=1 Tax=Phenylobacterium deserti TaxID=1914756 RepID=A0A328AQC9_9CAUL|nr:glycosyltransferase [Phenylobacterium deserti]RAK57223.1 hypothetical protein DJ018_04540 [Phenylobacterium deserti]